jgi:3-methyladenine DNA glycosylase AlkD
MIRGVAGLPEVIFERLIPAYEGPRDPQRAAGQTAYMRGRFPFLGLTSTGRRSLDRAVLAGLPAPAESDLRVIAERAWTRDEREYQYFACDYLRTHAGVPAPQFLGAVRGLLTTKSWWDTVDPLATRVVGAQVRRHPQLAATMDAWSVDDDVWLVRTAILHQLHYGTGTDTRRLFGYCTRQAGHRDFFVRKAIGWALRQYARTDPSAVRQYVDAHRDELSPLSVREAAKHL